MSVQIPIFYASSNASKVKNLRNWLAGTPYMILTPNDLPHALEVEESGNSVIENAVLKVKAYDACLRTLPEGHPCRNLPVLAHDTGLYIEGFPEERQPGIHVRRLMRPDPEDPSRQIEYSMSDQEALEFYCNLAKQAGGKLKAQYFRGAALIKDGELFTMEAGSPFMWLLDKPCHPYLEKGNPLDVSTIDSLTGKYWCDLTTEERDAAYGHFGTRVAQFLAEHL